VNREPNDSLLLTLDRVQTRVGHTEKQRRYTTKAARIIKYLYDSGGTIDFQPESEEMKRIGLTTIWRKIAYDLGLDKDGMPVAKLNMGIRWDSSKYHHGMVAGAIKEARQHLLDDHRMPLYVVPRYAGQKSIQVITIFGDHMVNEAETAKEIALKRGPQYARAYLKRGMDRVEAITGSRALISEMFHEIVKSLANESLSQGWFELRDQDEVA
jgi:hypothetical protein